MDLLELIKICEEKCKGCKGKYDFKKKHGYWYKKCYKNNIMDIIFPNYDRVKVRQENQLLKYERKSDRYTLEFLLEFCRKNYKTVLPVFYRNMLTLYYKLNLKDIEFKKVDYKKVNTIKKVKPKRVKPKKIKISPLFSKYDIDYVKKLTENFVFQSQFKESYLSIYKYYNKNKLMHNLNLIKDNISKPQMVTKFIFDILLNLKSDINNRRVIFPYEIDIYYDSLCLGIEYDGKKWHTNNKNDEIKNKICLNSNILLIRISENTWDYEKDIKNQIILNLPKLNSYLNTNYKECDISSIEVDYNKIIRYCIDDYKIVALKYKNKHDFLSYDYSVYMNAKKLKVLDIITQHMVKVTNYDYTYLITESKKYNGVVDFRLNNRVLFDYCNRNHPEIIKDIRIRIPSIEITDEYILNNYKSLNYLMVSDYRLYSNLRKNKRDILDKMDLYDRYFLNSMLIGCESYSCFKYNHRGVYNAIKNRHEINYVIEYFQNKNYNIYFTLKLDIDKIKKLCKKYDKVSSFQKDYPKIIKYIRNNNLIDEFFSHTKTLNMRNTIKRDKELIVKINYV
jgi:hypothetical protein